MINLLYILPPPPHTHTSGKKYISFRNVCLEQLKKKMQPRSESISGCSVLEARGRKPCALWSHLHPNKEGTLIGEAGPPAVPYLGDHSERGQELTVKPAPPGECGVFRAREVPVCSGTARGLSPLQNQSLHGDTCTCPSGLPESSCNLPQVSPSKGWKNNN